ncbi:CGNR zinc finger domain-containing protein [Streptomyces sp. NPDC059396]|uniref:CGNR zinc finger domain-containing protein n=1 Tax=Streptomyces sp. NPDC059396 TaxID=3346819 RepID=UPI0036A5DBDF
MPPPAPNPKPSATAQRTAALINALTTHESPPANAATTADTADAIVTVTEVLREHGEADPIELSAQDIADMRTVALKLREVFAAADVDSAAASLNRLLRLSPGPLRLTSHDGLTAWHPHLDSTDDAPWAEWFLASSCLALTVLVWDRQRPPGGICASAGCRNVYVTQGSGLPRRYCSRRCATRERVAAHRRAHA